MPITAAEQLLIELINRARLDPLAEAARYGIALNQGVTGPLLTAAARQPLAENRLISAAADAHSNWMLAADVFSHTGAGGSTGGDRMTQAGYVFLPGSTWGENISFRGSTAAVDLNAEISLQHRDLFLSAGHRVNMLKDAFEEIGVAQVAGVFATGGRSYNAAMLTENFAASGPEHFLTGVAYADGNNNRFYDIGEGRAGVGFAIGNTVTTSQAAGGYALADSSAAAVTVTITAAGQTSQVAVDLQAGNIKLDVLLAANGTGTMLLASGSVTLLAAQGNSIASVQLIGIGTANLVGNASNNLLVGNAANNRLDGGFGNDILRGGDGNDTLRGGNGSDVLNGGLGDDFIFGGDTAADLRDAISAGGGNDRVDGGAGNDEIFGEDGNDTIEGGMGADVINGQAGNDVLTGSAFSDLIYGGTGADFINGGFGFDRLNGGPGADRFYHQGVIGHGSDWVQDFHAAEGDVLVFGGAATRAQFQVNLSATAAGQAGVQEAFVVYRPTGQILWALVDGAAQAHINLALGAQVFDLLV